MFEYYFHSEYTLIYPQVFLCNPLILVWDEETKVGGNDIFTVKLGLDIPSSVPLYSSNLGSGYGVKSGRKCVTYELC